MPDWIESEIRAETSEEVCKCEMEDRIACDNCEVCKKASRRQLLLNFSEAESEIIKEKIKAKIGKSEKYDKVVDLIIEANYIDDEEKTNEILEKARKILSKK
jgi:DNA invertase Pin-like site-specific DNA recombinase